MFYIKPEDGEELPAIMKWMKQVFAQRYNREEGRIGHIWGDRYWSEIVEGEPFALEGTVPLVPGGLVAVLFPYGVRPSWWKTGRKGVSPLPSPMPPAPSPGLTQATRPVS
jgi:hypothetical protein